MTSDADDQMGGTGGEHGSKPEEVEPGKDNAAPRSDESHEKGDDFPASDPPGNY
ncbi:MAG TPA: hypothetical protein VG435_06190 [Acidimicrobiales bacterium]|jgi:hypothetical protein|nr:hypothetical protein [Acidimicrobiales bacterium]